MGENFLLVNTFLAMAERRTFAPAFCLPKFRIFSTFFLYILYIFPLFPQGEDSVEYFLGLTPSGIVVLRNKTTVAHYYWPRIAKVYYKGRYFMLRISDKNVNSQTHQNATMRAGKLVTGNWLPEATMGVQIPNPWPIPAINLFADKCFLQFAVRSASEWSKVSTKG